MTKYLLILFICATQVTMVIKPKYKSLFCDIEKSDLQLRSG